MQATETTSFQSISGSLPTNDSNKKQIPKILVVEDEFLTALNIQEDLILSGYEVPALAKSGEEAIRLATELQPDLILMDILLDGSMTGIEAATEIRKTHPIPMIYLTAHSSSDMLNQAKLTEPFGYLSKPCSQATLKSMIEMALHKNFIDSNKQELEKQQFETELSKTVFKVQEANTAIKVLLEHRNLEIQELEQNIQTNASKLILPVLEALENSELTENQRIMAESIRVNLQSLTKSHTSHIGQDITQLSSTEIQVANFVKAGKSTKEICQFLHICASTVNTHRDNIRKKLGIKNTKMNLKKALQQLLQY
ncbi:MAG: response regulator [Proteobacteria bacterium]|nr:response regulator [Pseudomonadota bacterium]MBU1648713.1 response regulator [Pseudomonadota bacterium]